MNSTKIIKLLEIDSWCEVAIKGSYHQFKHASKSGRVTVPHPKKIYHLVLLKTYLNKLASNTQLRNRKKVIMFLYIAIHKNAETGYGVTVPSLPGCFSYGDTLDDTVANAKEAIQLHIEGVLEDGEEPNIDQQSIDTLIASPEYSAAQWIGIEIDLSHLTLKPERFNVSRPKYALDKVDKHVLLTHDNRSNFLAKAALNQINQHN
ncbi:type II toxin-antitoxin system HicB family antitoxin [Neisseriaceae bacterium ESL0693]|nr:type II toxin-antitoxin system HicB family antitoxin [Neisseriaceae bacterium ESL0693]